LSAGLRAEWNEDDYDVLADDEVVGRTGRFAVDVPRRARLRWPLLARAGGGSRESSAD
jgi:hypothetical protein